MFVKNFDKSFWKPIDKMEIDKIRIDKSLFSYNNEIMESTVLQIISNFDLLFWIPITLNKDYYLLDGQHRLEAAKRMNLKFIDVVVQDTKLLESNISTKKYKFRNCIL